MDKNRTEGTRHEIKGALMELIGKVTGDRGKEDAGNFGRYAGKLQKVVGKSADWLRAAKKSYAMSKRRMKSRYHRDGSLKPASSR